MHEPRTDEADLEGSYREADFHVHAVATQDVIKIHIRETHGDNGENEKRRTDEQVRADVMPEVSVAVFG